MAIITGELTRAGDRTHAHVKVAFRTGEQYSEGFDIDSVIDSAKWQIRVFKLSGRQPGGIDVRTARDYFAKFGGVMVYDAGFRLPYYGVEQDWLRIEFDHSHRKNKSSLLPERLHVRRALNDLPTKDAFWGLYASTRDGKRGGPTDRKWKAEITLRFSSPEIGLSRIDHMICSVMPYVGRWTITRRGIVCGSSSGPRQRDPVRLRGIDSAESGPYFLTLAKPTRKTTRSRLSRTNSAGFPRPSTKSGRRRTSLGHCWARSLRPEWRPLPWNTRAARRCAAPATFSVR